MFNFNIIKLFIQKTNLAFTYVYDKQMFKCIAFKYYEFVFVNLSSTGYTSFNSKDV